MGKIWPCWTLQWEAPRLASWAVLVGRGPWTPWCCGATPTYPARSHAGHASHANAGEGRKMVAANLALLPTSCLWLGFCPAPQLWLWVGAWGMELP